MQGEGEEGDGRSPCIVLRDRAYPLDLTCNGSSSSRWYPW